MDEVTKANSSPPRSSSQQKRQEAGSGDVDFQQTVFHKAASDSEDGAMNEVLRSWVSETGHMLQEAQSILVRTEACLDKATIVAVNLEVLMGALEASQQSV